MARLQKGNRISPVCRAQAMNVDLCAEQVRKGDPDRFLSAMTARPEKREALFVLYAFNLEVARIPWLTQETLIAEMRFQWWLDTIEEIGAGKPNLGNEVATALSELVQIGELPRNLLTGLVRARQFDIYRQPFGDKVDFWEYVDQSAGNLMWLAALSLGAGSEAERTIRSMAKASGLAALLRALPELRASGRPVLADVTDDALRLLATEGLDFLHQARAQQRLVERDAAPALLAGWQTGTILRRAEQRPSTVLSGQLAPSEFHRRSGLVWRHVAGWWR